MKYITLVLSLLLIVSCAHVPETSTTSSPLDVDGTWKGVWNSEGKYGQPPKLFIFKLKSDGDSITGTGCDTTNPDKWYDVKKIKRKGNTLYFSVTLLPRLKCKYEAQVDGDIMNVTFRMGPLGLVASGSFTLEREKSYDSARELKVIGVSTNVVTFGLEKRDPKEPVIILQSGALVPMEYWGSLILSISEYGPIIAYDRPGIGGSSFDGVDPSPQYVVDHLHELLKTLKVPPPYILVGHSWGGPLILYYAGRYPEEVAAMVYIDPTDPRRTAETFYMTSDKKKIAEMKAESEAVIEALAKGLFDSNPGAQAEKKVAQAFQEIPVKERNLPDNPIVPTAFILATRFENPGGFSFMNEAWYKKRMELRISRFRNITQSLPQATLILATDVGHNIPMGAPDLIVGAIRRIRAQLQAGPPKQTQHTLIDISSEILRSYAGVYNLVPGTSLTVTADKGKLMVQATGQGKIPFFPESETKFFCKLVDAQISFFKDKEGKVDHLILHQGGIDQKAVRKNEDPPE